MIGVFIKRGNLCTGLHTGRTPSEHKDHQLRAEERGLEQTERTKLSDTLTPSLQDCGAVSFCLPASQCVVIMAALGNSPRALHYLSSQGCQPVFWDDPLHASPYLRCPPSLGGRGPCP